MTRVRHRWLALLAVLLSSAPRPAHALTLIDPTLHASLTVLHQKVASDKLRLKTRFEPVNPSALDVGAVGVKISAGTFSETVPGSSFRVKTSAQKTVWTFKGTKGKLGSVKVSHKKGVWELTAAASAITLAGTTNPILVALDFGADHGERIPFFAAKASAKKSTFTFPAGLGVDADGDGTSARNGDCNDQDPLAFPGAAERCNGADDNCDGTADEGFTLGTACAVGVGKCRHEGVTVCTPGGTVGCSVTSGVPAAELCGNGVDDDCDGATDEDFVLGDSCTVGAGSCQRGGFTICAPDGTGTVCDVPEIPGCELGPPIAIVNPANLTLFNHLQVTVSGTVAPTATTVDCNGHLATLGQGFSVILALDEGSNVIACVARDADGNARTATATVTVDTQPPRVTINAPADAATVPDDVVTVTGLINDIVVGTVNQQEAQVTCNGIEALVANRNFVARDVPLAAGSNTITCVGTDRAGNADTDRVDLTRAAPTGPTLRMVSGDDQTSDVGTALPAPLVVELTDAGTPLPGKAVLFTVQRNDGSLTGGPLTGRRVAVVTDANGRAAVAYTLGHWAGAGVNQVLAVAPGFPGEALFTHTAVPGPGTTIVVDSGGDQEGAVGQRLANPLVVAVVDAGGNRVAGVPVVFGVVEGGGNLGGAKTVTVTTDGDGRAGAVLTLGPDEGVANNGVFASFAGNPGPQAAFAASGRFPGNPLETRVIGVVVDNTNTPIAGVTVGIEDPDSLTMPRALTVSTQTNAEGRFVLAPVRVGHVVLQVEGATAARLGTWPRLAYDLVTIAGRDNDVGMPIYLLPIDFAHGLEIDETHGGTITLPDVPGFALTIAPGSVTFLDGTTRGTVSVTLVHPDKVPMVPNFGQQPNFVVTIQTAGVHFNPPAPLTIPNADALAPGEKTEMYSFDHDLGQFVSIGPGTVSDDGTVIASDPGVGVIKGGWHSAGPPASTGAVGACRSDPCVKRFLQLGTVYLGPEPSPPPMPTTCVEDTLDDGLACGSGASSPIKNFALPCGIGVVDVEIDQSCQGRTGVCRNGVCIGENGYDASRIVRGVFDAVGKICNTGCITGANLRNMTRECLAFSGVKILCTAQDSVNKCADTSLSPFCLCVQNEVNLYPAVLTEACAGGNVGSTIMHEMLHAHGCEGGSSDHNSGPSVSDRVYACQESCFPHTYSETDPSFCAVE